MSAYQEWCEKAALDALLGELDPATDPDRVAAEVVLKVLDAGRLSECPEAVEEVAKHMPRAVVLAQPAADQSKFTIHNVRDEAESLLRAAEDAALEAAPPKWRGKTTTLKNVTWEGQGLLYLADGCSIDMGDLAEEGFLPMHSADRKGTWTIILRFKPEGK